MKKSPFLCIEVTTKYLHYLALRLVQGRGEKVKFMNGIIYTSNRVKVWRQKEERMNVIPSYKRMLSNL